MFTTLSEKTIIHENNIKAYHIYLLYTRSHMQKLSSLSSINHVVQVAVPGLNIRKVLVRWSQYIPSYWLKPKQHVEK
jgi:flagellar biosynthesis/type III secretory pathway M-ring protein FliF/YscJ